MKQQIGWTPLVPKIGIILIAILLGLLGGCQCGEPPPTESIATDGKQTTDGGPKENTLTETKQDSTITCTSPCDCAQGQQCTARQCVTGKTPTYCCDNTDCVAGQACVDKDGKAGTCPGPKTCKADSECGNVSCTQNGVNCVQLQPSCVIGNCVNQPIAYNDATCSATGKCIPDKNECQNHCDCLQGQFCEKGKCFSGESPVYCCDKAGCPSGKQCFKADNSVDQCNTPACKSDSDCGQASCRQDGAKCVRSTSTCGQDGVCTSQQSTTTGICNTSTGTCTTVKICKTHCDCEQGVTCIQGQCVPLSSRRTFCCTKLGCLKGEACYKPDGSPDICGGQLGCSKNSDCGNVSCQDDGPTDCIEESPLCAPGSGVCSASKTRKSNTRCDAASGRCIGSTPGCKVHCDCPQGEGCFGGQCSVAPNGSKTYCCEKAGCTAGQACQNRDGSLGTCPSTQGCKSDSDCPKPSCSVNASNECNAISNKCDVQTGKCIASTQSLSNGQCSPTNRCEPKQATCTASHCDCPQGQFCYNGKCYTTTYPLYCCDNKGCPAGNVCATRTGQQSRCPTLCTSPCDCPEGQNCSNGICKQEANPVYCCDSPQGCPSGAACVNKSNQKGTCPTAPRSCKVDCDCLQGEACLNGTCQTGTKATYCCEKNGCPVNSTCTDNRGLKGTCPQPCQSTCDCPQGVACVNGSCKSGPLIGQQYCCENPGCPANQYCVTRQGRYNRCPTKQCNSPCDCTQGEDCRNGQCIQTSPPVYCCSKAGCPSGDSCKQTNNTWSTCPTKPACSTPCDCPQGQDCYKGTCVSVFPQVYCCEKSGCPGGQTCYDSKNVAGQCPGSTCKVTCDCPIQGQTCVRGNCVYLQGLGRVYCCDKQYCPTGNKCEDKQGVLKTCKQKSCSVACDCDQGEDCRNGQCVLVQPPVYCCSKLSCPQGQACKTNTGSSSFCGSAP